ncbi:unnamed protein product, partial [Closterium sp. NIES-54]
RAEKLVQQRILPWRIPNHSQPPSTPSSSCPCSSPSTSSTPSSPTPTCRPSSSASPSACEGRYKL